MSGTTKGFWDDEQTEKPPQPLRRSSPPEAEKRKTETPVPVQDVTVQQPETSEKPPVKTPEKAIPEQVDLRKKNKRDIIIIASVVTLLIAAIASLAFYLYNGGNRQIYTYIDSGYYAVAFNEMNTLHENGENVDSLVIHYIKACMDAKEYKRAVNSLSLLSDKGFSDNAEYLKKMVHMLKGGGKAELSEQLVAMLKNHHIEE